MRIAAIDLGSNSFHMLVAELLGPSSFEVVLREKMMIQLGKNALVSGRLDSEAMERGLACLDTFRLMALARRVERTLAVATSAIREAENGDEFLRRARSESGIAVRVITGREEARLIHLAVSRHVDLGRKRALIVDLGGGSVELIVGDAGKLHYATSQKLGFLRLHGRFVAGDPMTRRERQLLGSFLGDALATPMSHIRKEKPERVIATSGTAMTLLRLARQRRGEEDDSGALPARVSRAEIRAILADTLRDKAVARARSLDLDPLRAQYLPTALICVDAILDGVGAHELTVCPVALREGLIYDFMEHARPRSFAGLADNDLRMHAALDLAVRCSYPAEHSHKVAVLAGQIFKQSTHLHGLGEGEARLLDYAAILHDIGYHIGYDKHHKHGSYLIMNGDLRGFTPEERSIVAQLVRYHRRATPRTSHPELQSLPVKARRTVKYLTAILRIADGLDRSHYSLVEEVKCRSGRGSVHFQAVTGARHSEVELDLYTAKRHARYFEKVFDVRTSFTTVRPAGSAAAG